MTVAANTIFGGRWVVERPLSSGGMGAVYVAKHQDTGRPVALKVIKAEVGASEELIARFKKETGALAAISHPNVVTFLDSGVEDGQLFLVMELLSGRPLRSIMKEAVPPARALRICADLCRALAAIHAQGIIHRDLKPENVFLVDAVGHEETAKLIDFGIVRLESAGAGRATATQTGAVVGTPGYIAPEQLQGQPATAASDVYAVGVILYELVTGRFPFDAPTTHAMLVKQLIEPLPPPRSLRGSLPQHVEDLVLRLMSRDPAARIATAKDALAELVAAERQLASGSLAPGAPTEHAVTAPVASAAAPPADPPQQSSSSSSSSSPPPTSATPHGALRVADVPRARNPARTQRIAIAAGGGAGLLVVAVVVALVRGGGSDERAASPRAAVALTAPDDPGADGGDERSDKPATAAPPPRAPAPPETPARATATRPEAPSTAPFVGTWRGTFTGQAMVGRHTTPEHGASESVRITTPAPGKLALQFLDATGRAPCTSTFVVRGDRAVFSPEKQRCKIELPGGDRINDSTGALKLEPNGSVAFDVSGGFAFYPPSGAAAIGSFKHHWVLRRR